MSSYQPPSPEGRQPDPEPLPPPKPSGGLPKWIVPVAIAGGAVLFVAFMVGAVVGDDDEQELPDTPSNEEILGPELVEQACDDLDDLVAANPDMTRGEVIDQVVESFDDSAIEWRLRDVLWGCTVD